MPRPSSAPARAGPSDRTSLYQEITSRIIAELEAGRLPWVQPWGTSAVQAPLAMPKNAATGRRYSGINVLILWGAVVQHGFSGQSWLTFRQALVARRPRPQGRARHDGRVRGPFCSGGRARARGRGDGRGRATRHSVPEALHRVQHRSVRGPARGDRGRRAATVSGADPAGGGGADRGERRRFADRRRAGLSTTPARRLRPGAAAAGLFRADQLAPDGAARARALERRGAPARPRPVRRVRVEILRQGGAGGRDDGRLRLRLARHRADGAPCRLHRRLARGAARGQPRDRARGGAASKAADYLLGFPPGDDERSRSIGQRAGSGAMHPR